MGSENMTEVTIDTSKPAEAVPAKAEEQTPAQGQDNSSMEVVVNVEGGSETPKQEMTEEQLRAAWKEEKRKRKAKNEELTKIEQQNKDLQERLAKLEQTQHLTQQQVIETQRGPRPDPFDFTSSEEFYEALDKWQSFGKDKNPAEQAPAPAQTQAPQALLTEDQEWQLHKAESELKAHIADYDDSKTQVNQLLQGKFGGPANETVIADQLTGFAQTVGVNPAKVFYALSKMPEVADQIYAQHQNGPELSKILRDLESRVTVRQRTNIDTKPEPSVNGGGAINALNMQLEQARKAYAEDSSIKNYQALQAVKKRIKQNKEG